MAAPIQGYGSNPVTLVELTGNPTPAGNIGFVYTKDVSARTELFYEDDQGGVVQITSGGALNGGSIGGFTANAVLFADAAGVASSEAAFTYNASTNLLTVDGITVAVGPLTLVDAVVVRDSAANAVGIRNGGTSGAQVPNYFSVYSFWASTTDFYRVRVQANPYGTSNSSAITLEKGSGTSDASASLYIGNDTANGALAIRAGNATRWNFASGGALLPNADNTLANLGSASLRIPIGFFGPGTAAAPSLSLAAVSGTANDGFYSPGSGGQIALTLSGVAKAIYTTTIHRMAAAMVLGWSSSADVTAAASDTTLARAAAGVIVMTSTLRGGDGASNGPTFTFTNYTTTGMYAASGPILCFAVNGGVWMAHDAVNLKLRDTSGIGWCATNNAQTGTVDTVLFREAAAIIQMGVDVNGAAIAQTFKAHDGITGTDIAGASMTFAGGRGTGAGTGASLIFATATTLGTGTTAQTLVTRLTLSQGIVTTDAATLTFADKVDLAFNATTGTKIGTATTQKIAFWNATPVIQQVGGVTLTNNVTAGGTTNQLDDFTSLTVYATDAAAIRNNIYQLGRKVKLIVDALRTTGYLQNADA